MRMRELLLDAETLYTREQLHDVLAKVCGFPADYGRNLDALYDCLSEFFTDDSIIILFNGDEMKNSLGVYGDKLVKVFEDAMGESGFSFIYKS